MVVTKRQINPMRKDISAIFSSLLPTSVLLLIAKKERILLIINKIIAAAVNSSIKVSACTFNKRNDVSTMKQIPSRLEEVFRICGEVFFLSSITGML